MLRSDLGECDVRRQDPSGMPGMLPVMVHGIDYSQVPVQVRPFIAKETNEQASPCIQCNPCGNENQLLIGTDKYFTYDYVIGPEEDQNPLYDKAVAPLLDGFFSGYNSCILAYGQTVSAKPRVANPAQPESNIVWQGSGKTHTMGSTDWTGVSEMEWGVIPRVMDQVFRVKAEKVLLAWCACRNSTACIPGTRRQL